MNQKIANCPSLTKFISMAGFFSKKQYAAITANGFSMKLLNERGLEYSICAMFFSSSLTVSIKALFLTESCLQNSQGILHIILFLVTSCIPLRKRFSNSISPIYPLSAHNFPFMFSRNRPCFNG